MKKNLQKRKKPEPDSRRLFNIAMQSDPNSSQFYEALCLAFKDSSKNDEVAQFLQKVEKCLYTQNQPQENLKQEAEALFNRMEKK